MTLNNQPETEAARLVADDFPLTILLVDDQFVAAEAVRIAFADEHRARVHHCADGHAALALAQHLNPTVILQDLVMPGVNGLRLVEQYRAHATTRDVPVIVLSSEEKPAVKREAFRLGANDYVIKSADAIELVARVRRHVETCRTHAQLHSAYRVLRDTQQQLLRANTELQQLTKSDGLTGINNRRFLDEYLANEWRRAQRDGNPLSVLMIDVDHFKRYNDSYGHVAGDQVLRAIAQTIRAAFARPADLVARYGGEEFMAVLPNTAPEGARLAAEKVRRAIQTLNIVHDGSQPAGVVTVSIGIAAVIPQPENTLIDLTQAADRSLYDAKKLGRNRIGPAELRSHSASGYLHEQRFPSAMNYHGHLGTPLIKN